MIFLKPLNLIAKRSTQLDILRVLSLHPAHLTGVVSPVVPAATFVIGRQWGEITRIIGREAEAHLAPTLLADSALPAPRDDVVALQGLRDDGG